METPTTKPAVIEISDDGGVLGSYSAPAHRSSVVRHALDILMSGNPGLGSWEDTLFRYITQLEAQPTPSIQAEGMSAQDALDLTHKLDDYTVRGAWRSGGREKAVSAILAFFTAHKTAGLNVKASLPR